VKPRAAALALALSLLASGRADAYVRARVEGANRAQKFWAESCIPVTIYLNKFTLGQYPQPQMSIDAVVKSLTAAAHAWSPDAIATSMSGVSCDTYLEIVPTFAPVDAVPPAVASDHRNSVIFRTENWSKSGLIKNQGYSGEAVAVTTVFALLDGKIQDADIEINGTHEFWTWANLDAGFVPPNQNGDGDIYDLQNALTHEFGHLLGLEHTCFEPREAGGPVDINNVVRPIDDKGNGVPDCAGAPSSIELTVMYYRTRNQDTSKRVLSSDEVRFLCEVYPADKDPQTCRADQANTGCATGPAPARRARPRGGALGLLAGGGLILAAAWRRARRVSARARARA
jgi:hypothetical protein